VHKTPTGCSGESSWRSLASAAANQRVVMQGELPGCAVLFCRESRCHADELAVKVDPARTAL
jgi:hypothetical protein